MLLTEELVERTLALTERFCALFARPSGERSCRNAMIIRYWAIESAASLWSGLGLVPPLDGAPRVFARLD